MKQVSLFLFSLLIAVTLNAVAAESVPDNGLRAEMDKRWQEAISIYKKSLQSNPEQAHLWKRISDIEAHLGRPLAAVDALEKATRAAPRNAQYFYLLSLAHASLNQPGKALAASRRAVELEPRNIDYLSARAQHANWAKDHRVAIDSYLRILEIKPNDHETRLNLARSYNWEQDYEHASIQYQHYVDQNKQDKTALMEYMEVEAELGRYDSAASLAELYRQRYGESLEYWLAISDIYALSGNDEAAAEAIDKASRYAMDDPAMFYKLAQSFTSIKNSDRALKAIQQAIKLDPDNLEFYRTQAELASWRANYPLALESYQQILKRKPDDIGALLGVARVYYWMAETDASIEAYERYLQEQPNIQAIWVEYIQVLTETGNYSLALHALDEYRRQFGENDQYRQLKAQVFAWSGHPRAALAITTPMLEQSPDNHSLRNIHTIALANNHQPREAVDSLAELYRIDAKHAANPGTSRYINTPLRSSIRVHGSYLTDTDDIDITRGGIKGTYVMNPQLMLWLAAERQGIEAPLASGYATLSGDDAIDYTTTVAGVHYSVNQSLALDAEFGSGKVENGNSDSVYNVTASIWPMDALSLRLNFDQRVVTVSPLSTSLEIERKATQLDLSWQPDYLYTVDAMIADASFSDGNGRQDLAISPRRAMIRQQHLRLDLGIGAHWFGYDQTLNNGYYSPTDYERYSVNLYTAWWFNENDGINLSLSIGPYQDNTMDSYKSAGDLTIEGIMGAYKDWMLEARASFSQNTDINIGAYRSRFYELVLTRRF